MTFSTTVGQHWARQMSPYAKVIKQRKQHKSNSPESATVLNSVPVIPVSNSVPVIPQLRSPFSINSAISSGTPLNISPYE